MPSINWKHIATDIMLWDARLFNTKTLERYATVDMQRIEEAGNGSEFEFDE